jgi:MoxR-like ATPase
MDGRPNAAVEDVRDLALAVLGHRVWMNFQAEADRWDAPRVVREVLAGMG